MCYEAVIKDLHNAKDYHQAQDMDQAYHYIRHAQDIITELLIGLDYERGGEIAHNLNRLYNFMLRELVGINAQKDPVIYEQLIHMLSELKDAWEQIRNQHPAGHAWQDSTMGHGNRILAQG